MRTWKLTVNERELKILIEYNCNQQRLNFSNEFSTRIHDLTKRLNKVEAEANGQLDAAKEQAKIPEGW